MKRIKMLKIIMGVVMFAVFAVAVPADVSAQLEDTTPPELMDFDFIPTTIDVSAGSEDVTFTMRLTDELSGVWYAWWWIQSPSGQQLRATSVSSNDRISGDELDGIYQKAVEFPQHSEAGVWHVTYIGVYDVVGNLRMIYETELIEMGFPTEIQVISVPDDKEPPQLIEFSFNPTTIDVSAGSEDVTFTMRLTDELSGVWYAWWWIQSPSGQQLRATSVSSNDRISGDELDGIYQKAVEFPQYSEAGVWHVTYIGVYDVVGNLRMIYETELAEMRFPTEIEVGENQVKIDIKPGSEPNSINPDDKGVIPVAILTTNTAAGESVDFDATTVDPLSVKFGPGEAMEAHGQGHIEDIDGDGDLDMVLHFKTPEIDIQHGDTEACLTGETFDGQAIKGCDAIVTVPKGKSAPALLTFSLGQNFKNPFNPDTWIPYTLADDVDVVIRIYSLSGQLVRTLHLGHQPAGCYTTKSKAAYWDGKDNFGQSVTSGVYFYTLQAEKFKATRKMVIMK